MAEAVVSALALAEPESAGRASVVPESAVPEPVAPELVAPEPAVPESAGRESVAPELVAPEWGAVSALVLVRELAQGLAARGFAART